MYQNERNAYITGFSLFLFFVLRRLLDIQRKLHEARQQMKEGRIAKGQPAVDPPYAMGGKPHAE